MKLRVRRKKTNENKRREWGSRSTVHQPDVFLSVHGKIFAVTRFQCLPEIVTNAKQADHNDSERACEISLCMSDSDQKRVV